MSGSHRGRACGPTAAAPSRPRRAAGTMPGMSEQLRPYRFDRVARFMIISIVVASALGLIARISNPALVEDKATTNWVGVIVWSLSFLIGWRLSRRGIKS